MPSADLWAGEVEEAYERAKALEPSVVSGELADVAVYHYHPSLERVWAWIGQAGLVIEEEGTGNGYEHFVVSKKATHTISDS